MDLTIHICSYVEQYIDRTIHIWSYVDVAGGRGGVAGASPGGRRTATATATAAATSQQRSHACGQTPGPSRPRTKYPVRGQSLTSSSYVWALYGHATPDSACIGT